MPKLRFFTIICMSLLLVFVYGCNKGSNEGEAAEAGTQEQEQGEHEGESEQGEHAGEGEERRKSEVGKHKKDNKAILNLLDYNELDEWPKDTIIKDDLYMWNTNLTKIINNELGADWNKYLEQSYNYYGNPGGLKKNPLSIARALKLAWEDDVKSNKLIKLVKGIVEFAKKSKS